MTMNLLLRANLITKVHHLCNNDKSHSYSNRPVINRIILLTIFRSNMSMIFSTVFYLIMMSGRKYKVIEAGLMLCR